MENSPPPSRRTRAGQRAAEDAEKLEEQRNFEACPWVMMVGKGEEVRQRHADRVHDERRRELDAIETGEGVPTVKTEVLEEENILENCEENRQESDQVEHEDVDIKEESNDCDEEGHFEDSTFQEKNKLPEGSAVALEMDWLQGLELKEEEAQDQSTCVGEGGAGCEGLVLIDHDQEESVLNDAQAVKGSKKMSNGGEVDQIGQQEANNSGQYGEERAQLNENQNKESNRDTIINEAEAKEEVSALARKYSIEVLKKISFELGNFIKTACDVSGESGSVGTKESLGDEVEELLQVEMHNTETSLEPGCSEPCLKSASHVQICLGNKDGSNSMNVGDVGLGWHTSSILRDVDEEAVDDVEHEADQQVQVLLDSIINGSVSTDKELDDETTSTQVVDQDSNEGCVKKALSKKRSLKMKGYDDNNHVNVVHLKKKPFSCKVNGCEARFGSKKNMNRHVDTVHLKKRPFKCSNCSKDFGVKKSLLKHVDTVHLKKRPFSCKEDGCQARFGSKQHMSIHVDTVHLKKRPFSCKEDGCQARFGSKENMNRHVDTVHLKKRPFSCKVDGCGAKFGSKTELDRHVDEVHLKKRRFSCKEDGCQARFGSKKDMKRHVDTVHLKKRPFKCSHCSKDFGMKQNLSTHIKVVHQKEKAFLCQELGCGEKFATKMMLKDHMRYAHGAPKLLCTKAECSATFAWVNNLYYHMKHYH